MPLVQGTKRPLGNLHVSNKPNKELRSIHKSALIGLRGGLARELQPAEEPEEAGLLAVLRSLGPPVRSALGAGFLLLNHVRVYLCPSQCVCEAAASVPSLLPHQQGPLEPWFSSLALGSDPPKSQPRPCRFLSASVSSAVKGGRSSCCPAASM